MRNRLDAARMPRASPPQSPHGHHGGLTLKIRPVTGQIPSVNGKHARQGHAPRNVKPQLLSIDDIAPMAEVIGDRTLRSLDAIHLATAYELRTELTAFVCYDKQLRDSAHALGVPLEFPG
jgi:hypothetical protein